MRHTATLLLTLCILLSSAGIAFCGALCQMDDQRAVALQGASDGCCKGALPNTDTEKDECCTKALSFDELDPVSAQKAFQLEVPVFFPPATPAYLPHRLAVINPTQLTLAYADSSPPRAGRHLLHFIQILII